jgi:hypothetical protein
MPRSRPTMASALVRAARSGQPVQRVEIPKVECPRCGSEVYAAADGTTPRPHMRSSVPGESGYRADVPTMTDCLPCDEGAPADGAFDQAAFH